MVQKADTRGPWGDRGNYVAVVTAVCPVCGAVHDTNELVLHKRMMKMFPPSGRTKPMQYELCNEHSKLFNDGYIAAVGIDTAKSTVGKTGNIGLDDAWRTGRILHIKSKLWDNIFNVDKPVDADGKLLPMLFVDDAVIDHLQSMQGPSHGG